MNPVARMSGWLRAEARARRAAAQAARDTTPPPPSAFGRFGDSVIVPPARVTSPESIFIGDGVVILEQGFLSVVAAVPGVEPRLTIGDRTRFGAQAQIACVGEIEIGPDVLAAARVFIGDTYHEYEDPSSPVIDQPMAVPKKVTIGAGAFLGVGSAVLMGVTVGEHAYVGAGAVVIEDVAPFTVVVGNPARAVKRWDPDTQVWVSLGRETG